MSRKPARRRLGSTNVEIAGALSDIGDLLDLQGENQFKVRAYETAARAVSGMGESLADLVDQGADLEELPAIGEDIAAYIEEIVNTGRLTRLEELEKKVPRGLLDVLHVEGLGPKRTKTLWKELNVENLADLEKAAREGSIADLPGFGEKTQQHILDSITGPQQRTGRFKLSAAEQLVAPFVKHLGNRKHVEKIEVAGSYRRRKETVGDIDLLIVSNKPEPIMDAFTSYSTVQRVLSHGNTRSTVILSSGLQVDLRVVPAESFGAALLYFTGSKDHNIALRRRANDRKLKISEYGIFKQASSRKEKGSNRSKEGDLVCGATEEEMYEAIDLVWIPPELRENRGEIEAAEENELPELVELEDIRGDLQMHSTWSDGKASIAEMVKGCIDRDYQYMALTDHSESLHMTHGLDPKRLKKQWAEIDKLMKKEKKIHLLKSLEIDIHDDGSLDLDDEFVEQLDVVLVSIHSKFKLSPARQTKRIVKALKHPSVNILAHPTGRLINERKPMDFDMREVLKCAADHNVAVEVNAQPDRLDLNDEHLLLARDLGVKIVINTDAHSVENLGLMRYGVDQARRAWLTKGDVLNTRTYNQFKKAIAK